MQKEKIRNLLHEELKKKINSDIWAIQDEDDYVLIQHKTDHSKGFRLSLDSVMSKLEKGKEPLYVADTAGKLAKMAEASLEGKKLKGQTLNIFPVLRSSSHPTERQGVQILNREHTPESKTFYALDLGQTYVLIDEPMRKESGYSVEEIHKYALANLKRLATSYKEGEVAGNKFYFFSYSDGYSASRVLNDELLTFMKRKMNKEMGIAVPHQDVLIVADIQNDAGLKILSKMNMDFCMKGDIPVSPLPFILTEDLTLEPIMVMSNPGGTPRVQKKNKE